MAISKIITASITDNAVGSTQMAQTGSTAVAICRAWAFLQNTSGVSYSIVNSFNVSSYTRVSTGNFTLSFTNTLPNASYSQQVAKQNNSSNNNFGIVVYGSSSTTTSGTIGCYENGASADPYTINYAAFC